MEPVNKGKESGREKSGEQGMEGIEGMRNAMESNLLFLTLIISHGGTWRAGLSHSSSTGGGSGRWGLA